MFAIILIKPRNPNNIGAAARALANFGLEDLRVVSPYPPVWEEAQKAAAEGKRVLQKARVYATLGEAVSDVNFTFALTSLKNRNIQKQIYFLPQINEKLKELKGQKTAFIFGSEKTGLCAQDIESANAVLNIPTCAKTPSINLAQAVILTCYEIAKINAFKKPRAASAVKIKAPKAGQIKLLLDNAENMLSKAALPPTLNKKIRQKRLSDILQNSALSEKDLFFINSLLQKLQK